MYLYCHGWVCKVSGCSMIDQCVGVLPGRGAPAADQEEGPVRAGADVSQQDHQEIRLHVWRQKVSLSCTCMYIYMYIYIVHVHCTCTCTLYIYMYIYMYMHMYNPPVVVHKVKAILLVLHVQCIYTCKSHSPKFHDFVVLATAFIYIIQY